jgi:predicted transposase YdaD
MSVPEGPRDAHDRFFKHAFEAPEAMAVLLRRMLPAELLAHLDTSSLRPGPTERTSSRLGGRTTDLGFTIDYVEDGTRYEMFLVVEHQSNPDLDAPLRFLVTSGDVWHAAIKASPSKLSSGRLPVILPLLFTQHPARTTPTRLSMILDVPPSLREIIRLPVEVDAFVDDFSGSVLDDPIADPVTLARVELARAFLHAYKNPESLTEARLATLAPLFDVLVDQPEPLASQDLEALCTYVIRVFGLESTVRRAFETIIRIKRRAREMYATIADSLIAEGRAQGRAEGQARAVLNVLALRNLSIPASTRERVLSAQDESQLDRWLARALNASSADEIFEANNHT